MKDPVTWDFRKAIRGPCGCKSHYGSGHVSIDEPTDCGRLNSQLDFRRTGCHDRDPDISIRRGILSSIATLLPARSDIDVISG